MKTPELLIPYERNAKRMWLRRPHPIVLFSFAGYLTVGLICGFVMVDLMVESYFSGHRNFISDLVIIFWGLIAAQMLGMASLRGITYFTSYLLVTDKHLVIQQGIARELSVLEHKHIERTGTKETILGRILGYGRVLAAPASGDYLPTFPVSEANALEILINDWRKSRQHESTPHHTPPDSNCP